VFGSALPDRFATVVGLAAAGLLAIGLDWLLASGWTLALLLGVVLAAACVVPLLPRPYGTMPAAGTPAFFTNVRRFVPAGSTVLVLPYPTGTQTQPMAWQAAADMAFQMPGGYFIGPAAGGQAYVSGPGPLPLAVTMIHIEQGQAAPAVTPALRAQFRQDLAYWGAGAVVAGPGTRAALTAFMAALLQRPPLRTGGVLLWR